MLRYLLVLILSMSMLCLPARAEQKQQVGDYDIHYTALASVFLTPAVAKHYQIQRSRYTGIVNITVLDKRNNNAPVAVVISGVANNLLNTNVQLDFREIREANSIYYIAEIPLRNNEDLHFNISIKHGRQLNTKLKFKQEFFVD